MAAGTFGNPMELRLGLGHQGATDAVIQVEKATGEDAVPTNDRQLACARIVLRLQAADAPSPSSQMSSGSSSISATTSGGSTIGAKPPSASA